MSGAASSASLVSCISSTSGVRWTSHSSTRGSRALSELTFQVAMRIRVSVVLPVEARPGAAGGPAWLVAPAFLAGEVELGRVGDAHDGHRAGLDGIGHDEVGYFRNGPGHVQADDGYAHGLQFPHRSRDVAAHDRAGEQQGPGIP